MGMKMKVDFKELQAMQKRLEKAQKEIPNLMKEIALEIGNEFLQRVQQRTPNSDNNKLKNAWELQVTQQGNNFIVTIKNETEYASMVEYGHRTAENGWKNGRFMLTITEREIEQKTDTIASKKLQKFLQGIF